jgi:uncharacterized protein (TIGR00369 family)
VTDVDAGSEARVRASFQRQGLMRLLGAELSLVEPGRVEVTLARRPEVSQQHGYVHAGATSAIADSAGGYAALTLMPPTSEVLTVEYKLDLLAPAAGDLEAIGTVLRPGRPSPSAGSRCSRPRTASARLSPSASRPSSACRRSPGREPWVQRKLRGVESCF